MLCALVLLRFLLIISILLYFHVFLAITNQKRKKNKFEFEQKVEAPYIPQFLIQIKASNDEVNNRIERFMERKRKDINLHNVEEFCCGNRNSEYTCARIDATVQKRKDSKSHLQGKIYKLLKIVTCRNTIMAVIELSV